MQAFCQCISPGNSTFRRPDSLPHTPFSTGRGRPACSWPPCRSKTPRRRPFLSGPDSFPGPQKECSRFPISGPSQTSMARADPQAAPPFPAPSIHQTVYMISLEMSSFPTHLPFLSRSVRANACHSCPTTNICRHYYRVRTRKSPLRVMRSRLLPSSVLSTPQLFRY